MEYALYLSAFLFAATPYALVPFVVLKLVETQNHSDDIVAFEAERLVVNALARTKTDIPVRIVPRRNWLIPSLLALLTSMSFQTINAATSAKMTVSAVVVVTCKILVSAVKGEKIKSTCDAPFNKSVEPVVTKDEEQKEITVSY